MSQNRIQYGGDHYQKEYQHWDFVNDCVMDYFMGNATKYICRKKWGVRRSQDLKKAIHYLRKRAELGYIGSLYVTNIRFERFASQFDEDTVSMLYVCRTKSSEQAADYIEFVILPKYEQS